MDDKIYVQFKNSEDWRTYCIWLRKDLKLAKIVGLELDKKYSGVRVVGEDKKVIWRCERCEMKRRYLET